MIRFLPLGGGDEIGASCYFLEFNGYNVLLDAGLRPRSYKNTPNFSTLFELIEDWSQIDAVFITHPHLDHVGSLPKVFENKKNIHVFVPENSLPLISVQILESLTIQRHDDDYLEDYMGTKYAIDLVSECLSKVKEIPYFKTEKIPRTNVYFEFWPAGHICGSASVFLKTKKGNIVYTGDISTYDRPAIPNLLYPKRDVDLLIMESTYLKSNGFITPQEGFNQLYSEVREITRKGNNVLIPCFALGKAQDIVKMFADRSRIESNPIPIYIDGLAKKVSLIYEKLLNDFTVFEPNGPCREVPRFPKDNRRYLEFLERNAGAVIVSSSGMLLDGSKSAKWAEVILPYEGNGLFFTGYLDEESPGARLMKSLSEDSIDINDQEVKLNAKIDRFYISTHSPPSELQKIVKLTDPKQVILVHGNNSPQEVAKFQHQCELDAKKKIPMYRSKNNEIIELGEICERN